MAKKKAVNKNLQAWRSAHVGHAVLSWTSHDVLSVAPKGWTEAQAEDFLQRNSRQISDRLSELGFQLIETLIQEET